MTVAALIPVGSAAVRLISDGDRIVASLKDRGPFEPNTLARWAELCRAGETVVDVGAYTGLFTISARLLGARCIAFEPMPANRARLKANAELNRVSDKVNSEAVSDTVGRAELTYNPIPYTSGASLARRKGVHLDVAVLTIDSLRLQQVSAIKIDVERAEPLVLAGARETLARCRPTLIVEVLGEDEGQAVLASIDGYRHVDTLDVRNWIMEPA